MICAKAAAALRGALERGSVRKGSLCGCAGGKGGLCTSNCGSERCTGRGVSAEAAAAPRGALESAETAADLRGALERGYVQKQLRP